MNKRELIDSKKKKINKLKKELLELENKPDNYQLVKYKIEFMHGDGDADSSETYTTENPDEIEVLDYLMNNIGRKPSSYYSDYIVDWDIVDKMIDSKESLSFIRKDFEDTKEYLYEIGFYTDDVHFYDSGEPASVESIKRT